MPGTTNGANLVPCINCGGDHVHTAYVRSPKNSNYVVATDQALPPDGSRYVILRCVDCGSVFLHPAYFEESFAVYESARYFEGYFQDNIHVGGGPSLASTSPRAKRENRRFAASLLSAAGIAAGHNVRVVDIGCGGGDLVRGFADLGCDASGVDVSEQAIAQAQSRGLSAIRGRFEDLDFPAGHFDLIVSIETFEHMADLAPILAAIRRALKPGGALVIQVPNDIDGYRRRWFRRIWWMIPPMHIRYFTRESLRSIFGRHGFRVERIRTTGSVGRDLASVLRWRLKRLSPRRAASSPVRLLLRVMPVAFAPADAFLNARRAHSETIVVFRPDEGESA